MVKQGLFLLLCLFGWDALGAAAVPAPGQQQRIPETPPVSLAQLKGMRDPFKQLAIEGIHAVPPEIETIPVDQFHLVGVITGPSRTRAILRGPSGKIFVVYPGQGIGTRNGHIRRVLEDEVIVDEVIVDAAQDRERVVTEIKLPSEKEAFEAQQASVAQAASNDVVVHDGTVIPSSVPAGAGASQSPPPANIQPPVPAPTLNPIVYPNNNGGGAPPALSGATLVNPFGKPASGSAGAPIYKQ